MSSLAKRLLPLLLLPLLILLGAAGYRVVQAEPYTVYVDGAPLQVHGAFDDVGELLAAADVTLRPGDIVIPALTTPITPDAAVQIVRARSVALRTETQTRTYTTHQTTIGGFLREAGIAVQRSDQLRADGVLIAFNQIDRTPLPRELALGRFHPVTIQDGAQTRSVITGARTVGAALQEAGITLFAADGVDPLPGSWITPDMTITIRRSQPYTIRVDGRVLNTRSHAQTPLDVLAEAGVGLVGRDYTNPPADAILTPNSTIDVIRVTEDFYTEDSPIAFATTWEPTDRLEIDTVGVLVAGQDGILRRRTRITYENGVEASRTPDGEWVALAPVNRRLGYGTNIVIRTIDTPDGPLEYWRKVRMRVTSYTAATSGKAADHPAYGITASGRPAGKGIVAVDRNVVPFRTNVYVPGYGVGYAGDTGGGIIGRWIDLGYDEDNFEWWRGYVDVYYLTPVPAPERINYLIPTALP